MYVVGLALICTQLKCAGSKKSICCHGHSSIVMSALHSAVGVLRRQPYSRSRLATLPCPLWEPSLVTPYNCRLGDLLCLFVYVVFVCFCVCMHMCNLCFLCFGGCFPLQLSPNSVLWLGLLTCKNRLPYNLYCVCGYVKHCTIQSNPALCRCCYIFRLHICMTPRCPTAT